MDAQGVRIGFGWEAGQGACCCGPQAWHPVGALGSRRPVTGAPSHGEPSDTHPGPREAAGEPEERKSERRCGGRGARQPP